VRVIPTWTDPTVRRASEAIGGPMCRHALVGQIGQRLPNDHLVVRVVFPASGVPADRGRPARPAVLGRSASWQGAPPGERDTTVRAHETYSVSGLTFIH
jgi:hypothetical protein